MKLQINDGDEVEGAGRTSQNKKVNEKHGGNEAMPNEVEGAGGASKNKEVNEKHGVDEAMSNDGDEAKQEEEVHKDLRESFPGNSPDNSRETNSQRMRMRRSLQAAEEVKALQETA